MKYISTSITAMFLCFAGVAQQKVIVHLPCDKSAAEVRHLTRQLKQAAYPGSNQSKKEARQMFGRVMGAQAAKYKTAAKTTAASQRVIAQANYYIAPFTSVSDSFIFKYSGTRGSSFLPEYMTYTPYYTGSSFDHFYEMFGYDTYYGTPYLRNEAPLVKSDTTIIYSMLWTATPTFGLLATESHTYDASNNLLDNTFIGDTSYYSLRDSMTYNSDGSIATVYQYQWIDFTPPAYWNLQHSSHFSYDGAGRMVADSQSLNSSGWIPQWKYTYNYDASGNMTLAQRWEWDFPGHLLTNSYVMTYDGAGKLQTYRSYNHETGTPELEIYDSLGYTSGVPYPTYFRTKEYSSGVLSWMDVLTKNMGASGKPDTMHGISYDEDSTTVLGSGMAAVVYNSFNNPVTMVIYYDDGTTTPTTEEEKIYYYYEPYETSAVADISNTGQRMTLYPNPATEELKITIPGAIVNEPVAISICDMAGRNVKTISVSNTGGTLAIPVADIPQGIYIVTAMQNGKAFGREKMVKQ